MDRYMNGNTLNVNILTAIFCIAAVTIYIFGNDSTLILQQQQAELSDHTLSTRQTIQPQYNSNNNKMNNNNDNKRNMVGGYSLVDTQLLLSTEIMDVASFYLNEYASKFAASDNDVADASSFVVLPQDVESGNVVVKVLDAQRQVSAGCILCIFGSILILLKKVLTSYVHFYLYLSMLTRLWQV